MCVLEHNKQIPTMFCTNINKPRIDDLRNATSAEHQVVSHDTRVPKHM